MPYITEQLKMMCMQIRESSFTSETPSNMHSQLNVWQRNRHYFASLFAGITLRNPLLRKILKYWRIYQFFRRKKLFVICEIIFFQCAKTVILLVIYFPLYEKIVKLW